MKDPNTLYPEEENTNLFNVPDPSAIYSDEMKQFINEQVEKYIPEKKKIRPGSSVDYMKPTVSYDIQRVQNSK